MSAGLFPFDELETLPGFGLQRLERMEAQIWRRLQRHSCCCQGSQELGDLHHSGVEEVWTNQELMSEHAEESEGRVC